MNVDQLSINTIRFLAADAVETANSGHPGMPLGAAPMAYVLWDRYLKFNPRNPHWFDRDRFVLSAGHGSMLQYALLHLYGYDLSLDEIKNFRQWGSKTAGHPEYGVAPGVECTTGPLGQGVAMAVGMAMAEKHLAARFNGSEKVVDHYTYALCSDGDLMEGVSAEAASLAGTWKLGKLIYLYDDNHITIDGATDMAFTEDVGRRYESYGWHVSSVSDGNDLEAIDAAIAEARAETERPSLICVRTHIGFGSPKQDSPKSHGEALGADALRATKENLGWPLEPWFHIPAEVAEHCRRKVDAGQQAESNWERIVDAMGSKKQAFRTTIDNEFASGWTDELPVFALGDKPVATRSASGKVLNAIAGKVPSLIGGSADLAGSNKSLIDGSDAFAVESATGRNVYFGVREHAMGAIVNGMALHGGTVPYGATFLIFSDYMRPAIRLAALQNIHSIFVFTHDSVGLGEDGPTHQPIEQLASLRAIPRLLVFRPADGNETSASWRLAMEAQGPSALALTRQNVPVLGDPELVSEGTRRGAYVLESDENPGVVLVATGSEVQLAQRARARLAERGIASRVVSMPCRELFLQQNADYRQSVIPIDLPKVVVEAASPMGWRDVVGDDADIIAIDHFGESAPGDVLMEKFGFTDANVVERAVAMVQSRSVTTGGAAPQGG